jgi:hypothetical protein
MDITQAGKARPSLGKGNGQPVQPVTTSAATFEGYAIAEMQIDKAYTKLGTDTGMR